MRRKTLLRKFGKKQGAYSINHILGCCHGCRCRAFEYMMRFGNIKNYDDWTNPHLVSNALELLDSEIPKLKGKIKSVRLCSATDPFMCGFPEAAEMSLAAIEKLNAAGIGCSVLTKGVLPEMPATFSPENEYGVSLLSLDEAYRKRTEPGTAPYAQRLASLHHLHEAGLKGLPCLFLLGNALRISIRQKSIFAICALTEMSAAC